MTREEEEVKLINELIQGCLKEEGYEIPDQQFKDSGYVGFQVKIPRDREDKKTIEILIHY